MILNEKFSEMNSLFRNEIDVHHKDMKVALATTGSMVCAHIYIIAVTGMVSYLL
jgi:hypothetical protein